MTPVPPDRGRLDDFELPPDLMSATFEHAISDDASVAHERGHAVAAALQRALKGSSVEYDFPGVLTARLHSGAVARCGGPAHGWRVEIERTALHVETLDVGLPAGEKDPKVIAAALAKLLKRR